MDVLEFPPPYQYEQKTSKLSETEYSGTQMWRYHKPSFELLLLGELQRQQQSSVLCDTILQADGISVPAHSCILSAFSPQFFHTLSAAPSLPTGRSHLLQFQAVRAHTLLKLVGFLYSGEMEGWGEHEREEVITAAWKLGIEGLVEVAREEGEMLDKCNRRESDNEKTDCEDDGSHVNVLGRKWEKPEGLINLKEVMRAAGMMMDRGMQTDFSKDRMTGEGEKGRDDQDMSKIASTSESQTEVSEIAEGRAVIRTEMHISVLRHRKADTGARTYGAILMDKQTDMEIPHLIDRRTDKATETDAIVFMAIETDTPVWPDREKDTGTQTDMPVWMDRETDAPVWLERETDTGTQTDPPVQRNRWTETDDGDILLWPLPPTPECSGPSSAWSWSDSQPTKFSVPLVPSCVDSEPPQPSPVSSSPLCDSDNSRETSNAWDLQGEGAAHLATPIHGSRFPSVRDSDHRPNIAGHMTSDASLMNACATTVSIDRRSSGPSPADVTNPPTQSVFPVTPFKANITADTAVNSSIPSITAPGIHAAAHAPADPARHSDTLSSVAQDGITPTQENLKHDTDIISLTPAITAAESACLVTTAGALTGTEVHLCSVSEAVRMTSSAVNLSLIAPAAELRAYHPCTPFSHMLLLPPRPHDCPLITTSKATLAQGQELLSPHQASPLLAVQPKMDLQGAIPTANKNTSGHFRSGGKKVAGDGIQREDAEENREFERFEGNIVGFINYFLNPKMSQEESVPAGTGKASEMEPSGKRKRGRPRKRVKAKKVVVAAREELGKPSSGGKGQGTTAREQGPRKPEKSVIVGARRGQGTSVRARFRDSLQPLKMKLKKQAGGGAWEVVRAESRKTRGGRGKGAVGKQRHTKSSISQAPSLSSHGRRQLQAQHHAPPPPPPPRATAEETAEQFEKLLDDMVGLVMELDANAEGICANNHLDGTLSGTPSLLRPCADPSAGSSLMDVARPCLLPEVVLQPSPCNGTPAMVPESDLTAFIEPASLHLVTAPAMSFISHPKSPLPHFEPCHGSESTACPSHCSPCLSSVRSHIPDETALCGDHSGSSSTPVDPVDSLPSCAPRAATVTGPCLTNGLPQTVTMDSETPERNSALAVRALPSPHSDRSAVTAQSTAPSPSAGVAADRSYATDTSPHSLPQQTTAEVSDILENILQSFESESELQCMNDGDQPRRITCEDGAEVQEEANSPDVAEALLKEDSCDVNGSKDTDLSEDTESHNASQRETQNLQCLSMPLQNILCPVQTEEGETKQITLEPELPLKTSKDTLHISAESQIQSPSTTCSKQQSSDDLPSCPSPSPRGLQIPGLMTEHLPADPSPKRLQSPPFITPAMKNPVPSNCSERSTGGCGEKEPMTDCLRGGEKVEAEDQKKKIVTRSQTKKSRTEEAEDNKRRADSDQRKQPVKRGLRSETPTWETHAGGQTIVKRLKRAACWCTEENVGKFCEDRFQPAGRRKWKGQTPGVKLKKRDQNTSTCSGKKPIDSAVKRKSGKSKTKAAGKHSSRKEESPSDKIDQVDSYMNKQATARSLANKPVRTVPYMRNQRNAKYHEADGVGKRGLSRRDPSEKMCKAGTIAQIGEVAGRAGVKPGVTPAQPTGSRCRASRPQVMSLGENLGKLQKEKGRHCRSGRKRRMHDSGEVCHQRPRQGLTEKQEAKSTFTAGPHKRRSGAGVSQCPLQDQLQVRVKHRRNERNSGASDREACAVRAGGSPLNYPANIHNGQVSQIRQCDRRVIKSRVGEEGEEEGEDCGDTRAGEQGYVGRGEDDRDPDQIIDSRGEMKRQTVNEETLKDAGTYSTGGVFEESGPNEMDSVKKPEADRATVSGSQHENNRQITSPGETQFKDNSITSGAAMSSHMPHRASDVSVRSSEPEGEMDEEVDVLECCSPICLALDVMLGSSGGGSAFALQAAVSEDEIDDEEGEEIDVTGEESD